MAKKYDGLTQKLQGITQNTWVASFAEIENVIGSRLPPSAREHPAWWANQGRAQSLAWEKAGWRKSGVDLKRRTVTFTRVGVHTRAAGVRKLTIAEAKVGLSAGLGVPVEAIEIVVKG